MCTTCGCGDADTRIDGKAIREPLGITRRARAFLAARRRTVGSYRYWCRVAHAAHGVLGHAHTTAAPRRLAHGPGRARPARKERRDRGRRTGVFSTIAGVFALNLVSSPGSGKTTLLVKTIGAWQGRTPVAVIEGDQQTSRDADRVREAGARAVQINTGKGCHLDAQMVANALSQLEPADDSLLLIENVGNLVCPAAFDLGEAHKVVSCR